jgi:hypothetical protein
MGAEATFRRSGSSQSNFAPLTKRSLRDVIAEKNNDPMKEPLQEQKKCGDARQSGRH